MKKRFHLIVGFDSDGMRNFLAEVHQRPIELHHFRVLRRAGIVEEPALRVGRAGIWTPEQKDKLADEGHVRAVRALLRSPPQPVEPVEAAA